MATFTSAPRALLVGSPGLGLALTAGACLDFGQAEDTAQPAQSSESTDSVDGEGSEPDSAADQSTESPAGEDREEPTSDAAGQDPMAAGSTLELEAVTVGLPQDWALRGDHLRPCLG